MSNIKELIKKAIKNGSFGNIQRPLVVIRNHPQYHPTFPETEIIQIWRCIDDDEDEISDYLIKRVWTGTFYDLFFGTDFVEKLVGETANYCDIYKKECIKDFCSISKEWTSCHSKKNGCLADYHRQQLTNMKDVDKMI